MLIVLSWLHLGKMLLSILRNLLRAVAYVFNGENLPFQIWDSTKVCSAHFQPSDFRKTLTSKRVLNKGAVPSIFQWTKPSPKSQKKTRLIQRRLVKAAATAKLFEWITWFVNKAKFRETKADSAKVLSCDLQRTKEVFSLYLTRFQTMAAKEATGF